MTGLSEVLRREEPPQAHTGGVLLGTGNRRGIAPVWTAARRVLRAARRRGEDGLGPGLHRRRARSGPAVRPPGARPATAGPPSRPTSAWAARAAISARRSTCPATARGSR